MRPEDVLASFFEAENKRDWITYRQFLHPEVTWQLIDKETKHIIGIEEYIRIMKKAYENTNIRFTCRDMKISSDGNRIVADLINDNGVRAIDIFDFKDNLIYREYEFILG